jgi:hypothetical integral membrane protein (TIGR02206 family)
VCWRGGALRHRSRQPPPATELAAQSGFQHFDLTHWAVLAAIPGLALLLAAISRKRPTVRIPLARGLAATLLALEIAWFVRIQIYDFKVTHFLPLQLSDASILLAVFVGWTMHQRSFDVLYYWALTVVPLAMITPDVGEPFPAAYTVLFFLLHGLVVVIVLYLLWSGTLRPLPGSMWRSFAVLNVFLVFVMAANWLLGTNFMYLMQKPAQPSPLDYMGPWPVYILVGEALALAGFFILWLPYRRRVD